MMRPPHRHVLFILILWLGTLMLSAQSQQFRFVTYNVENLFDCIDDSLTHDEDFLPQALRQWTPGRYWHKLHNVARVLSLIGEDRAPEFVALCEVESDSVLFDLTRRSGLRTQGYQYLMTHSRQGRGIDVALLYQPSVYQPIGTDLWNIPDTAAQGHVRDLLHVWGPCITGDTLDIVVCHYPSQLRGAQGDVWRMALSNMLHARVDSLRTARTRPHVIIAGDFNDSPHSPAMRRLVAPSSDGTPLLVNVTEKLPGTYRYQGHWEQLDQLFVLSCMFQSGTTLHVSDHSARVYRHPMLLEPDALYGGERPRRTYHGMRYQGGVSDHLPVVLTLTYSW